MTGISEATQLLVGFFAIISTIIGAVVALGKMLKKYIDNSIREATKIPIQRVHDLLALLNAKTDININYHKRETGNGYGKFFDVEMERYLTELQLQKAIEQNERPMD